MTKAKDGKTQKERFIETARDAECDESEERFEEALRKIVKQQPAPESEKSKDD